MCTGLYNVHRENGLAFSDLQNLSFKLDFKIFDKDQNSLSEKIMKFLQQKKTPKTFKSI